MRRTLLKIYDYFSAHRAARISILAALTVVILVLVAGLGYREDISDFIPFGGKHATALKIYQDISGADKIFITFRQDGEGTPDPDLLVSAVDSYVDNLAECRSLDPDSLHIISEVDMDMLDRVQDFVYANIPYLLSEADYDRIDSLLSDPDYVRFRLEEDKRVLQFPSGGIMSGTIGRDPLNLFSPVLERLEGNSAGETYDGHIFTPDMRTAIVMLDTPYGASESEDNKLLLETLDSIVTKTGEDFGSVAISLVGSPVIAVENADRIKKDSAISIVIAVTLILLLLFYVFRSVRSILLIALTIGWGWLFALAGLSLLHDKVSIIVVGISSVILGIAANYPLHMIAHLGRGEDRRGSLREIITPLLVGNITTVGAFLALVPLQSVALRDLGLFASFLLIGTIVFSIVFLPHMTGQGIMTRHTFIDRIGNIELETKSWMVVVIVILTIVFGIASLDTKFDSNMSHINYMSDEDRTNMANLRQMAGTSPWEVQQFTMVSAPSLSLALEKNEEVERLVEGVRQEGNEYSIRSCSGILCSESVLRSRVARWDRFVEKYRAEVQESLERESALLDFADGSFGGFDDIISKPAREAVPEDFVEMTRLLYRGYVSYDASAGEYHIVTRISADEAAALAIAEALQMRDEVFCFSMESLNSAISTNMSDNFNYIGWACGLIVFFFLWISMGNIEMALISFTPMAVSWLWILGIMSLLGIQFNIVNIILATFIFGQGDDYTIFITEGVSYEYTHGKKILGSYKHSIIVSAIIMFVGIGTLIVARHPALRSLAQVTIIGMFSVVLMAYCLPPLLFSWLVSSRGVLRRRPLTLKRLAVSAYVWTVYYLQLGIVWIYLSLLRLTVRDEAKARRRLHGLVHCLSRFDVRHIPAVKFREDTPKPDSDRPSLLVTGRQSDLDAILLMALLPRIVWVSDASANPGLIPPAISLSLGFITLSDSRDEDIAKMRQAMTEGYSLVLSPEAAAVAAEAMNMNITLAIIHGTDNVLPEGSRILYSGELSVSTGSSLPLPDAVREACAGERGDASAAFHATLAREYGTVRERTGTLDYFREYILDRYRYKGKEIYGTVRKNLRAGFDRCQIIPDGDVVTVMDSGYGELALGYALMHPAQRVVAVVADAERSAILSRSADGVVSNMDIRTKES